MAYSLDQRMTHRERNDPRAWPAETGRTDPRQSDEQWRALFEFVDDGFCVIEKVDGPPGAAPDYRYIEANRAFGVESGVPNVVGRTIREAFPGETEDWFHIYDGILESREPRHFERDLPTQGRVLELYAFPLGDAANRRLGVRFKDITERVRTRQRDRRAMAEAAALAAALKTARDAADLLVHLDDAVRPLTDPEEITYTAARLLGTHLRVNRCAYATIDDVDDSFVLTGNYTAGTHSIVGRYTLRQFGADCVARLRAGNPFVVTDTEDDPRIDGEDRAAYRLTAIRAIACVPILKAGRLVAATAVHSVTPRQWTASEVALLQQVASRCWESIERARIERERAELLALAERANRAKDDFLAMLGHELRNPLSPILTALQLMNLRGDPESARERIVIERQVRHLTRLVDDLLDVARIAEGKVQLHMETVELADIVGRAIEMASPLLEEGAHALAVDVPRAGLTVSGDPARLGQVISNLLTNASKYTPSRGRISVSAAAEGEQIVLRVRDTGIGIAAEVLPHVFDRFVQGRQDLDRSEGGLGLGLAIVRSLVERHGGQVSAHSDGPGQGSEFVVRLPAGGAALADYVPPRTHGAGAPASVRRAVLLVVDDNQDAAAMLAEGLRLMGHEVHVAHDGLQALRVGAMYAFDAAFLDIGLPVMDGFELAARLRTLPAFATTRLIAVTGYGQESDRARTAAAGFHEHLVKPVDLDVLEALVARCARESAG